MSLIMVKARYLMLKHLSMMVDKEGVETDLISIITV